MEGGWKSAGYDNGLTVRKNLLLLFAPVLYIENDVFYQDRLWTTVGKVEERRMGFSQEGAPLTCALHPELATAHL